LALYCEGVFPPISFSSFPFRFKQVSSLGLADSRVSWGPFFLLSWGIEVTSFSDSEEDHPNIQVKGVDGLSPPLGWRQPFLFFGRSRTVGIFFGFSTSPANLRVDFFFFPDTCWNIPLFRHEAESRAAF